MGALPQTGPKRCASDGATDLLGRRRHACSCRIPTSSRLLDIRELDRYVFSGTYLTNEALVEGIVRTNGRKDAKRQSVEVTHSVVSTRWLGIAVALIRQLPPVPRRFRRKYEAPMRPWSDWNIEVPAELVTVPGIWRNEHEAQLAFEAGPLPHFINEHQREVRSIYQRMARTVFPTLPGMLRSLRKVARTARLKPVTLTRGIDPETLKRRIVEQARSQGFAAIGVAQYDAKYTFEPYLGQEVGDRIIILIFEQNWERTQEIPSRASERSVFYHYTDMMEQALPLADSLIQSGYRAHVHDTEGRVAAIPYAVEAGLGQLGLNGQLLTPQAGSRCRLMVINTDAPLPLDQPRDFGIHGICDRCEACIERCPSGAIPRHRASHRGVTKTKIDTSRCLPIVAQTHGCAVCMKVCPVQRYGLEAVVEEFRESGQILGKGTDELEGYRWPVDGKWYSPGERPRVKEVLDAQKSEV